MKSRNNFHINKEKLTKDPEYAFRVVQPNASEQDKVLTRLTGGTEVMEPKTLISVNKI